MTMNPIGPIRDQLAKIIIDGVPDTVSVYRSAFDGTPALPAVIVGMPSWEDDISANYCAPHRQFPIACVVARPGTADEHTADQLDSLWPAVFDQLRDTSRSDPGLGGICRQSVIGRALFGQFNIQGQLYPAQLITIDLYG